MGSALRRCKNAKAALYNVKNAKIRVKELLGRGGEIRVGNLQREGGRQEEVRETQGRRGREEKQGKRRRKKERKKEGKERTVSYTHLTLPTKRIV